MTITSPLWMFHLCSYSGFVLPVKGARRAETHRRRQAGTDKSFDHPGHLNPTIRTGLEQGLCLQVAILEGQDPVHMAGQFQIVGGDHRRHPGLAGQAIEALEHLA